MPPQLRKRKALASPAPAPAPKKKVIAAKAKKPAAAAEKSKNEVKKATPKAEKPAKEKDEIPTSESTEDEAKQTEKPKALKKEKKIPAKAADKPAKEKAEKIVSETTEEETEKPNGAKKESQDSYKVTIGASITFEGFGGEVHTHDGEKTTLKKLVEESLAGVVIFTYPKASTPGCTSQVCLFRDSHESLTADGLAIYGLSTDSPKANLSFREKQRLPYPLLCDPDATLIDALGFKKTPKGTHRGVFVVDKEGTVLVAELGSPAQTVERVKLLVTEMKK